MNDNKIKQNVIYITTMLLLFGCSSFNGTMIKTGESIKDIVIQNAILDFVANCNLYKKDSLFFVSFEDTVYRQKLKQITNIKFELTQENAFYDGIVAVSIIKGGNYQYYYSEGTKVKLPSRHIIKDGKLFYWWDDKYPVSEEMIAVLWKYNLLQTDFIIPEFSTNDNQKGADYYFCKNDMSKYKRVITNIGLGYYKPPKLKCK